MEAPASTPQLPSRRPLFPPVTLSEDDAARFKAAARALLMRSLGDFDAYAQAPERRVDPARWRVLRTRENLTVYREREARTWTKAAPEPSQPPPPADATPRGNSRSNASSWSSSASSGRAPPGSDSYYNHSNSKRSGSTSSSSSSISSTSSATLPTSRRAAASIPPPAPQVTTTGSTGSSSRGVTPPAPYQQQTRLAARSYQLPADAQVVGADGRPLAPSIDTDDGTSTLPRLLSVGTVLGSLDDVMYGVAASDCAAVFLKAAYAHDDVVDADVLLKLEGPSPRDPFRFLGLKWLVKATKGSGVNKIVSPRDLVYLEATGVLVRPARDVDAGPKDYDRIGFQVMMSVQLPGCGELRDTHGIVRARTESCYLFKAVKAKSSSTDGAKTAPAASCEVYATSWVDPRGKVSESIALQSVSNTLLYVGSVVHCGQRKKLAWRLSNDTHGGSVIMDMNDERAAPARACGICSKSFKSGLLHKRRHAVECKLCFKAMCTRCSVTQTIFFADTSPRYRKRCKQVTPKEVELCKSCITATAQASALEIARAEVMSGRFGRVLRHDRQPASKPTERGKTGGSTTSARANHSAQSREREPLKPASTDDQSAAKTTSRHRSHRPVHHRPDAPPEAPSQSHASRSYRSRPHDDQASSSRSHSRHDSSEQEPAAVSKSLGSSHGPPVVLLEPGQLADDLSSSQRREKQSNSVASRASSKSSSSSDRGGVYDSEIEDDFDDVDEVLETSNMKHVPHVSMVKNKLFMQMAELRSVAEDVYQYARTNTAVHLTAASGSARAMRNSEVSFDD